MISGTILLCVFMICVTIIACKHVHTLKPSHDHGQEISELKKKVDGLAIRAGFKS